jgi:hypothetical protein
MDYKRDIISNILYFIGYTFDFEKNIHDPPLDIEQGKEKTYIAKSRTQKTHSLFENIWIYLYNIFISLVIICPTIYTLYESINTGTIIPLGRSLFQVICLVQYINGIIYFNKNHFYQNIISNSDLTNLLKTSLPFTIIITLILTITNIIILIIGSDILGYTMVYNMSNVIGKVFICILLFVESVYSYQTFFVNTCIFVINMFYHKQHVSTYSSNLDEYMSNSMQISHKIKITSRDLLQMKDKFDHTVKVLTPFFTSLNIIGFLMIYFYLVAIEENIITITEIINMTIFLLIEFIYIYTIHEVNIKNEQISDTITSSPIILSIISSKNIDETVLNTNKTHNTISKQSLSLLETKSTPNSSEDGNEIITNTLVSSISTTQILNWMILQKIGNGKWGTFKIFGIELTDTKLISRIIGLIITALITTEIITIFNWWSDE